MPASWQGAVNICYYLFTNLEIPIIDLSIYTPLQVTNVKSDGLCTIAVGTPDYISPEILKAMEGNRHSGMMLYMDDVI